MFSAVYLDYFPGKLVDYPISSDTHNFQRKLNQKFKILILLLTTLNLALVEYPIVKSAYEEAKGLSFPFWELQNITTTK